MLLYTSKPYIFSSYSLLFPTPKPPNSTQFKSVPSFTQKTHFKHTKFTSNSSTTDDTIPSVQENDGDEVGLQPDPNEYDLSGSDNGVEIEIEKIGKNKRRIRSKIHVDATLQHVWDVLTDYEKLSDFIPSLAVNKLLEKRDKFARLFQARIREMLDCMKANNRLYAYIQQNNEELQSLEDKVAGLSSQMQDVHASLKLIIHNLGLRENPSPLRPPSSPCEHQPNSHEQRTH